LGSRLASARVRSTHLGQRPGPGRPVSPRPASAPAAPEPVIHVHEPVESAADKTHTAPALQLYLREVGQVQLLTPQEEVKLARRIRRGDEAAREHMIRANLRLVVKIARDYENLGLPLLDLINEGNMGLIKGVERFDPRKGAKLSTYASWWIKQAIKRALANQSKTIRLPVHVVDKVAHIRRAELKLRETFDREPTDEELAEEVELKPHQVREYRDAAKATVSLDAPVGEEDESKAVSEVVADPRASAPFEQVVRESDNALVREVFSTLQPREQEILNLRFGLLDDAPQTLEEIGQRYGLTRERIRQIEAEALKKLRKKMAKRDSLTMADLALAE
jgi:RNA polymerase primary sigma factor